jgi:hypothetical protein
MTAIVLIILMASIVSAGVGPWFLLARLGRLERRLDLVERGVSVLLVECLEPSDDDDPDGGIPADEDRASNVIKLGARAA